MRRGPVSPSRRASSSPRPTAHGPGRRSLVNSGARSLLRGPFSGWVSQPCAKVRSDLANPCTRIPSRGDTFELRPEPSRVSCGVGLQVAGPKGTHSDRTGCDDSLLGGLQRGRFEMQDSSDVASASQPARLRGEIIGDLTPVLRQFREAAPVMQAGLELYDQLPAYEQRMWASRRPVELLAAARRGQVRSLRSPRLFGRSRARARAPRRANHSSSVASGSRGSPPRDGEPDPPPLARPVFTMETRRYLKAAIDLAVRRRLTERRECGRCEIDRRLRVPVRRPSPSSRAATVTRSPSARRRRTAKLVAFCLSTYMNGNGNGWPSQDTIAAGGSITDRAVFSATKRLEDAGFLVVERSRGRSSHTYVATLPLTANAVRRSEWATATLNSEGRRTQPRTARPQPRTPFPRKR